MLKYAVFAGAFKVMSLTPQTRHFYRRFGNFYENRKRTLQGLPDRYVVRARELIAECEASGACFDGASVLEIGTGWVHWEATILALCYEVEATLFDVWDNRLWNTFHTYMAGLNERLDELALPPNRLEKARAKLERVLAADGFDQAYRALNAVYVIDPLGMLDLFPDANFDLVVSGDVLEHIEREQLPRFLRDSQRVLRPGGWSMHQIDLADHFSYFDPSSSWKNYYRFSERAWKLLFESTVQYFNRVQRPDWLALFRHAGLDLVRERMTSVEIGPIRVQPPYCDLSLEDQLCGQIRLVHRKPTAGPVRELENPAHLRLEAVTDSLELDIAKWDPLRVFQQQPDAGFSRTCSFEARASQLRRQITWEP